MRRSCVPSRTPLLAALALAAVLAPRPAVAADRNAASGCAVPMAWDGFLAPRPVREAQLAARFPGARLHVLRNFDGDQVQVRHLAAFPAGVDFYTDASGSVQTGLFYLAPVGPLYLAAQYAQAARVTSPLTTAQVEARYGRPARREPGRHGVTHLVYHPAGDPKLELRFDTLPGSDRIHRVIVDRGED